MYERFGHDALQRSVKRYQDHLRGRESGVLRMGTNGLIITTTNTAALPDTAGLT
jgi:hypothetical protein